MNTLEEPAAPPVVDEWTPPLPVKSKPKFFWLSRALDQLLVGLLIFGLSAGACGLFAVKNYAAQAWQDSLQRAAWLVLVQGETIQVDEVGRFLRQLEGVSEVVYVSPEDTLERAKADTELTQALGLLETNPFSPAWKVSWNEVLLNDAKMQEALQDVRTFPGVVDVAADPRALADTHRYRAQWVQSRVVISLVLLTLVLFSAVLFGRVLFFSQFQRLKLKPTLAGFLFDFLFWAAGFFAVFAFFGELPWVLLAGGVMMGLCRIAWALLPQKSA